MGKVEIDEDEDCFELVVSLCDEKITWKGHGPPLYLPEAICEVRRTCSNILSKHKKPSSIISTLMRGKFYTRMS